jgi:hypothetical protein
MPVVKRYSLVFWLFWQAQFISSITGLISLLWEIIWSQAIAGFEHTTTWFFDGGIVHALTIILQLRSYIACLIIFSGDAIWQKSYNSFMRYLLIITRNKLIVTHSIICGTLSLFAAVSLALRLNVADPWHECNRTLYGPDSGVHGIRFARDGWGSIGATFSMKLLPWSLETFVFLGCNQKFYILGWHELWDWWSEN